MGKATVRTSQIICKWHTWSFLSWTLCQITWHSTKLISLTIGNWTSVHKLVNIKGTVELILPLSGKYPLKIEEYSVFHPFISCPSVRGSRDTIMATPADTSDRLTLLKGHQKETEKYPSSRSPFLPVQNPWLTFQKCLPQWTVAGCGSTRRKPTQA